MLIAPRSIAYLALVVALSTYGPLTMSIYTPVMPSVGASLGAGADEVKLTLTTFMIGFALGQIVYGPLSDRFGRRPVLIVGLLFFVALSSACALASKAMELAILRFLQGAGASAGSVIGRALARDAFEFKELPRVMSWVSIGVNIGPAVAPVLGGFLGELYGWPATFWALVAISSLTVLIVAVGLPETNRHRSARLDPLAIWRGGGEMLSDRRFTGYILTMGFAFAINFGMVVGMPFIFQDSLGFSPREFGLLSIISVAGFTAGGLFNNRLIGRVPAPSVMQAASFFHIAGVCVMATFAAANTLTWWTLVIPQVFVSFGSGMMVPNTNAGAVGLYPRLAGTASSLVGLAQMGMGAMGTVAVAILTGLGGHDQALPLVGQWLGCRTAACAVPMPLVVGLLPFAVAGALTAWMLRRAIAARPPVGIA